MPFIDRADAGRQLAEVLIRFKDENPVVLALPRGGVPVAAEVAEALGAPLDLVLVRKIGVPFQPELAMGAIADGGIDTAVRNEDVILAAGVSEEEFRRVCARELIEIERRRRLYLGDRAPASVEGRTAIVIDDGIATGATTRAALRAVRRRNPARLILAVPVAPSDTLSAMSEEADLVICLEEHESFGGVSQFYRSFRQLSDEDVAALLARSANNRRLSSSRVNP